MARTRRAYLVYLNSSSCSLRKLGVIAPAVHPERRRSFARELIMESKSAITMISSCLEQMSMSTKNVYEHSLDAFAAWVRLSQGRLHADDLPVQAPQIDARDPLCSSTHFTCSQVSAQRTNQGPHNLTMQSMLRVS